MQTSRLVYWVAIPVLVAACGKDKPIEGQAPPTAPETKPGLCVNGGGEAKDPVSASVFPRVSGSYCIDPNGETRTYGADAHRALEQVCTELFDGECEVYRAYGLERVATLRYVDGGGSPGAVTVNLSRFASVQGAYGFYTKRIVADSDPAASAPAVLDAGGAAGLGTGVAYVWRGKHVAELSYTNELESPDQIKQSSTKILPVLARLLGEKMSGEKALPAAARALPKADLIPQGISFLSGDALGIAGVGPGAIGFYDRDGSRWRGLSIVRDDEAAASDVMKTLLKVTGARLVKEPRPVLSVPVRVRDGAPPEIWLLERRGNRIAGIGDEPFASPADAGAPRVMPDAERLVLLQQALDGASSEEKPPTPPAK